MSPTAYTCIIAEEEEFEIFIMRCARAFGPGVMMREESLDTPFPESFAPSSYYAHRLSEAKTELSKLEQLTIEEAERASLAEYEEEKKSLQRGIERDGKLYEKYEAMLAQVHSWEPPTEEHIGLKDFMVRQITESIEHDCNTSFSINRLNELVVLSGEQFLLRNKKFINEDIKRYAEHYAKEVERVNSGNLWLKQLRDSLLERKEKNND